MTTLPRIVIIGGTGAQGSPVVRTLSASRKFISVVLTRDKSSKHAQALAALPNVELFEGTYTNESDLHKLFKGTYGAYVNTDGFVIGEKEEIFWGMRIFEIAVEHGVQHYVYGNLSYFLKLGGYDSKYRSGHMDAKGRVGEWLLLQKSDRVKVTLFTTCGYAEMLFDGQFSPFKNEDGSFTFYSAIGDGLLPLIALEDVGTYVGWIFENPARTDGINFQIVTDIVKYPEIVDMFQKVTGKKALWKDVPYDEFAKLKGMTDDLPSAWAAGPGEYSDTSGQTYKQNFAGWWHGWKNQVVTWKDIDVDLLDEAHPNRIKGLEAWMRKTGYDGLPREVLKDVAGLRG